MTDRHPETASVTDSANGCPQIPLVVGRGDAKVIMWPGNGARHRTLQLITLEDGACTVALKHEGDAVYYIIGGEGVVEDLVSKDASPVTEGAMIHIDAGDSYRFVCAEGHSLKVLGGPCPADETLYASLQHPEVK